ncbi:hypothetical protein [Streptomyces virginiae]|uniref:hypothetical protein n=1 Tax=Streptomyces virginiae TaxID=1961 RepID=UPI00052585C5|nr:hypothetical protein [Streptomyces virginiae]MCX4718265.1 hypothetical protein [Streptomyces virginiae]
MTSNTELLLRQLVEETALEITDAEGRFRKRDLVQAVRGKLDHVNLSPDTLAIALDKLADNAVTGFGDQRNPRRRGPGSFFHPDDILKLGNGVWVWMRRATDSDLVAWRKQSRRNRVHVYAVDDEQEDYAVERLDAFRTNDGIVYLEDLERVVFHWTEDNTSQSGLF